MPSRKEYLDFVLDGCDGLSEPRQKKKRKATVG